MNKKSRGAIKAPTGTQLQAQSWLTEAPLRMLMNNLDPDVAERPDELVVYGGIGRAARNWECYERIVETLRRLGPDFAPFARRILDGPAAWLLANRTRFSARWTCWHLLPH